MIKFFCFLFLIFKVTLTSVQFVVFTQPKTGTHLILPILTEITGKKVYWAKEFADETKSLIEIKEDEFLDSKLLFFSLDKAPWDHQMMDLVWKANEAKGTFLHLHPPFSTSMELFLQKKECISFFVKRDPRDQIVSLLNHYKYINYNDKAVETLPNDDEKLFYLILKESRRHTLYYNKWINSPVCCTLDFAKLMGEHGGAATDEEALAEVRKISAALQLNFSDEYLYKVYKKHFGKSWNFFKGRVGVWKDYFNEKHKALIKTEIGDLLIELGFEKDYNW